MFSQTSNRKPKYFIYETFLNVIAENLDKYSTLYELFQGEFDVPEFSSRKTAMTVLKDYGYFNAISAFTQFEKDEGLQINTDTNNPIKLANQLWSIFGDKVIFDLTSVANYDLLDYIDNFKEEILKQIHYFAKSADYVKYDGAFALSIRTRHKICGEEVNNG